MKKQSRQLALIFSTIFIYLYLMHYDVLVLLYVAVSLIFIAIFIPNAISPFTKLWLAFGNFMHKIISPFFAIIIYYLMFTPMALITLLFIDNKFKKSINSNKKESCWIEVPDQKYDLDYFKKQF